MEDFIERAARAAYEAYSANSVGIVLAGWDRESAHAKNCARAQVMAVLETLVPPEGEMFIYKADAGDIWITRFQPEFPWSELVAAGQRAAWKGAP